MIKSHMSNSKVTYLADHAVRWGHMPNELHCIFIFTKPIATKLDRMMACEIKISTTVFRFLYRILTQLKKFLRWRYFVPEKLSFLHQFHQFPDKCLCGPNCFKHSGSPIRKKASNQHCSKIPYQEFKSWSTKHLKLIMKNRSWYIHDFFEPVINNASSSLNILIFWYFL